MESRFKKHSFIFSTGLSLILLTILSSLLTNCSTKEEPSIKELADKAGLLIGSTGPSRDSARRSILLREFNTATATCYPRSIHNNEGKHSFDGFNNNVNFLYERDMKPLHHMLFGPSSYESEWVRKITSVPTLDSLLEDRIRSIMEVNDNASKVDVWNVVNEALDRLPTQGAYRDNEKMLWGLLGYEEDKSGLTSEDKVNEKHPVFIRKSFEYAAKYARGKLELRDFYIESPCVKARAFYQLVRHLQNSGVRIDAVGFQCHFDLDTSRMRSLDPEGLASEVRKYKKLGLEVYFTEVDFGRRSIPWTTEVAEMQKQEYKKLITVALNEGVSKVYFWGLVDGDDKGFRTDENPLLFNQELQPKPAYYGVKEALSEYLKKKGK